MDLTANYETGLNPGRVLLCEDPANRRLMFTWLDPSATCENTPGDYTCMCPEGTVGDGARCEADEALVASGAGGCAAGQSAWLPVALAGLALLGLRRRMARA